MSKLPVHIRSVEQVRAMDRYAIERVGIPGYTLMTRAGEAALQYLRATWPDVRKIVVVCGFGNNAGDGYALARMASAESLEVTVIALANSEQLTGDAAQAWGDFVAAGGRTQPWRDDIIVAAELIVDAIFGTGLSRPLNAELIAHVDAINRASCPVFALDVPSGLNADTGAVMGAAVMADRTITFIGLKQGFYLGDGANFTGEIAFADLGIPPEVDRVVGITATRITAEDVERTLPPRKRNAHKGNAGRVLLVGGNYGMAGAIRLAAEACLRVGAGLVTVATRADNVASVVAARPELMCRAVESADDLQQMIEKATVVAVGPGLGQDEWSRMVLASILQAKQPLIVDADALNLLAVTPVRRDQWILTPHPGEASRLLDCSIADIQRDRMGAARALVDRFGGIAILKGAGTIVQRIGTPASICDKGNPGMATPGMGDVLTGVVAGVVAQSMDLWDAARSAVFIHAAAADKAAEPGERGLIASDLFPHLRACVNP